MFNKEKIKINWERIFLISIFLGFLLQTLFFVFYLARYFGPDERYHHVVSLAYSKVLGIPQNSPETFRFGDITRLPFLFYWLSGRFINIANILKMDSYFFLKAVSLMCSLLTMFFTWLISKEVIKKKFYRIIPVFMLACTMMFSFLGGIVTYDTMVNLCLVISFWALLLFIKQDDKNAKYLLIWIVASLLACATKFTALPLVAFEFLMVLYFLFKYKIKFWQGLTKLQTVLSSIVVILLLVINFSIYGINIVRYRTYKPKCDQVMLYEECMLNPLYRKILAYEEGSMKGKKIRELLLTDERMNPFDFFFDWEEMITPRLYGIFSHSSITFPRNFSFIYTVIFLFLMMSFIRYVKKSDKQILVSFFLMLGYVLVLAYLQHYYWYLKINKLDVAMQGRYLLPVIPAAYLVEVWSLTKIRSDWLRKSILILLLLVFFCGSVFILLKSIVEGGAGWYPRLFDLHNTLSF